MIDSKVKASGVAGAAATLVVFVASLFGLAVPATVAAALVTLVAFVAGYMKKNS